jgi:multiple sugar transport system substrate-binding protein
VTRQACGAAWLNIDRKGTEMNGLNRRRFVCFVVAAGLVTMTAGAAPALAATTVNMVLWPGPEGDAMQKVVDAWNKDQGAKEGVSVKMILLSRDNTFSRETTEIGAKSSNVDIYFVASYNVNFYQAGLEPIDTLGVDESNYFKSAVDSLKIGGKLYALPLDVSNHFLYYRKDLIARLLSDEAWKSKYRDISKTVLGAARDPKDPSEWDADDYLATAAFFSKSANPDSPTQYGTSLQLKTLVFSITLWDDLLWGLGGNWVGPDGKANLTSEAAKKAMNVYAAIYKNKWTSPDSAEAEFSETNSALESGNAAFALQWSAAYAELTSPKLAPKIADKILVAPMPGNPHSTHVHALAIALNKYAKNKDAAEIWMKYLATPAAMDAYAKAGGIPSMPKVLSDNVSLNAAFAPIAEDVGKYGYSPPLFSGTFDAMTQMIEALNPGWVGIASIDEALADADQKLQAQLDKRK